jgi:hypothetical protein
VSRCGSIRANSSAATRGTRRSEIWSDYGHGLRYAGRQTEGIIAFDRALSLQPSSLFALGRTEEALALMTSTAKLSNVSEYFWDPIFDPVRNDPRWVKLMADAGLTEAHARAQAWRKAHPPEKPAK